jgi:hypothetical protein
MLISDDRSYHRITPLENFSFNKAFFRFVERNVYRRRSENVSRTEKSMIAIQNFYLIGTPIAM